MTVTRKIKQNGKLMGFSYQFGKRIDAKRSQGVANDMIRQWQTIIRYRCCWNENDFKQCRAKNIRSAKWQRSCGSFHSMNMRIATLPNAGTAVAVAAAAAIRFCYRYSSYPLCVRLMLYYVAFSALSGQFYELWMLFSNSNSCSK